jgi:ArsR family transcriptional regulator
VSEDFCPDPCVVDAAEANRLQGSLMNVAGLSELFKALADETRTKILYLLSQKELCVCDIASVMEMSNPAVSHHLRLLRALRLVETRKDGKLVFYRLDDLHVVNLIEQARIHYIERQ